MMQADWTFVDDVIASPNADARSGPVDMVILHYTGMQTAQQALERLTSPGSGVSAHYLIDDDGRLIQMVRERDRAWHAGLSFWKSRSGLNHVSIGIELGNPGHEWGYQPFPKPQISTLKRLLQSILRLHAIRPENVIGHSDCSPDRKEDPGELFPWQDLSTLGLCVKSPVASANSALQDFSEETQVVSNLRRIGYGIHPFDPVSASLKDVLCAFQRRHRPNQIDGIADIETCALAAILADQQD